MDERGVARPVASAERIVLLDILRGLALFGILLVNFNTDYFTAPRTGADRFAGLAIAYFCGGSFLPIFAFLFGVGFALQVTRLHLRGAGVTTTYLRRLATLFGIGVANAVFLWQGDILRFYAIAAVPLLVARRLSSRVLVASVALCLLLSVKYDLVTSLLHQLPGLTWAADQDQQDPVQALRPIERQAILGQSYSALVQVRARMMWEETRRSPLVPTYPQVFGMFLLGLLAARMGLLARPQEHLQFIRRVLRAGLVLGVLGNFVDVGGPILEGRGIHLLPQRLLDFRGVFRLTGDTALAAFYVAAVTLLLSQHGAWRRWLAPLGQVGRMALTNYLMQGALMLLLMCGFGAGLAFRLGLAASVPLKLVLFGAQVGLSRWWMRRFRFGPAEWLWRVATYGTSSVRPPAPNTA